jgi:hypothetical protein
MLSVKDIQKIENKRKLARKELYKNILETFSSKIRNIVERGQTQIFLTIPAFVIGFPIFDRRQARDYISRQLTNLGYMVTPYGETELYVTWNKPKSAQEQETDLLPVFANLHKVADSYRNKKADR